MVLVVMIVGVGDDNFGENNRECGKDGGDDVYWMVVMVVMVVMIIVMLVIFVTMKIMVLMVIS